MTKRRQQWWSQTLTLLLAALVTSGAPLLADGAPARTAEARTAAARSAQVPLEQGDGEDELTALRRMLRAPGPDGREQREQAITQLLAKAAPAAHRLLQERLLQNEDPDALKVAILDGLKRHLLMAVESQFGGADPEVRRQILIGYVGALAPLWSADADPAAQPAARATLQRVPVREFEAVARALLADAEPATHVAVLYCLSDMQQTLLAAVIAESLEAPGEAVRAAAREALHRLTYATPKITTRAEFDAWQAEFGSWRYVDLAERAARKGPEPLEELRRQLVAQKVAAAREFVTAQVVRPPGIDWSVVQRRTIQDEPAVLDACLEALQETLSQSAPPEGNAMQRQAFCRALLDRMAQVPTDDRLELQHRRALLLEVAAYLARPEETELANELRTRLLAQLASAPPAMQIAALRGLRRYPSPEARAALVAHARRLLPSIADNERQLQAILDTLASRTAPRWMAPAPDAADKADWLQLVTDCCRTAAAHDLRAGALQLAQALDRNEARVPEAFGILMALVRDPSLDTKFRSTAMIYLEAWRADQALAGDWVGALHALLEDDAAELRKQAADSLTRLPESVDPRRGEWFQSSLGVLRDRLGVEPDAAVLRALVECVRKIGKQPQMPELAIGTIKYVLAALPQPVPPEHQFRLDPLLQALAAIAAEPAADSGQWLAACEPLLAHGKRQSVRLILQTHAAIDLTKDVSNGDKAVAARARRAMRFVIEAAALNPPRTGWASTEALQREARDVRRAFVALDAVGAEERLDAPEHRVLRLSVDLVAAKFAEVVQRAGAWLQEAEGGAGADRGYLDRLRLLAAEAQLALGKPKEAEQLLAARSTDAGNDPEALDLSTRVARALAASDPKAAVALFERTLRATATEDPAFRARLIDWIRHRLQHEPGRRDETLQEAAQHEALFEADDCPAELRQAFEQLRKTS